MPNLATSIDDEPSQSMSSANPGRLQVWSAAVVQRVALLVGQRKPMPSSWASWIVSGVCQLVRWWARQLQQHLNPFRVAEELNDAGC